MITEERISSLEKDVEMLKFWHFSLTRKTPQVTAMGVKAEIEYMVYPVEAGQQVFMNGGLSKGTIQRYQWIQTGGPPISYTDRDPVCIFIAPDVTVPTALTFTLTVTDTSNQTSQADVLVQVKPRKIAFELEVTDNEMKQLERANKETTDRTKKRRIPSDGNEDFSS